MRKRIFIDDACVHDDPLCPDTYDAISFTFCWVRLRPPADLNRTPLHRLTYKALLQLEDVLRTLRSTRRPITSEQFRTMGVPFAFLRIGRGRRHDLRGGERVAIHYEFEDEGAASKSAGNPGEFVSINEVFALDKREGFGSFCLTSFVRNSSLRVNFVNQLEHASDKSRHFSFLKENGLVRIRVPRA